MVVIKTPLKKEQFRKVAEDAGLTFIKSNGMMMYFENPPENDDETVAAMIKKTCKNTRELGAIYFSVVAEKKR